MTLRELPFRSPSMAELDTTLPGSASATAPTATAHRGLVTLADVVAEQVAWLWPGRLPLGKLVVLDGDPSVGKSTLTLDLAARVSTGSEWPDGAAGCAPAGVLLLSAEDGLADTIRPRLDAAGADPSRVHALTEVPAPNDDGDHWVYRPPSLPRDLAHVERAIREHGVRLVVVDVLMAFLSGKVDSHRDQDVRGVLHQLADLTARTECCMVLIRHLRKSHGGPALYAGGGSIGIVGAARAAFVVGRDPADESGERRVFAPTKVNLAVAPPTLAYRLASTPIGVARVEWEAEPCSLTADQLLRDSDGQEDRTERVEAEEWLRSFLTERGGQAARQDVIKAARAEGFSESTLKRARQSLRVRTNRRGFGGGSIWVLDPLAGSIQAHSVHSGQH